MSGGLILLIVVIVAVAAVGVVPAVMDAKSGDKSAVAPGGAANQARALPPGPAPAGKVWSAEHGHWHDAATEAANAAGASPVQASASGVPAQTAAPQTAPQPPGPAPAGQVWSAEHGHWHDAATGAAPVAPPVQQTAPTSVPQPPGPAPAGKVWSAEHGHWHDANQ